MAYKTPKRAREPLGVLLEPNARSSRRLKQQLPMPIEGQDTGNDSALEIVGLVAGNLQLREQLAEVLIAEHEQREAASGSVSISQADREKLGPFSQRTRRWECCERRRGRGD